jgi:riboflavin kinase / FMN adenylyltransferase
MKVLDNFEHVPPEFMDAVLTIGNFDGIHLGHRAIFDDVLREARRIGRKAVVMTFEPHPKMMLHPERRPFYLLTTLDEKIGLLDAIGIDALILIPFTLEFAETTAEEFITEILWRRLMIRKIYIGHDYTFGKGKQGNEAYLAAFGKKLGFAVDVVNAVTVGNIVASSTRIRNAILDGDVRTAAMLLGRPYNLGGAVIEGKRRGATLGFPTANVLPNKELIPPRGVYAAFGEFEKERYRGVLNIGYNPTFSDERLSIEIHLLDFNRNIYGRDLEILFVERIRDEVKFTGPDALVAQIRRDVEQAVAILNAAEEEYGFRRAQS